MRWPSGPVLHAREGREAFGRLQEPNCFDRWWEKRGAGVSMMQSADLRNRSDLALTWQLYITGPILHLVGASLLHRLSINVRAVEKFTEAPEGNL